MKMRYIPLLLVISILLSSVQAADSGKEFLADFVIGKYLLVGKKVDSFATYFGHVELFNGHGSLKIKRHIGGKTVLGQATIESAVQGDATVLRMRFDDNGAAYENNCLIQSDLDNYARISCYLYQPGVRTLNPGLEVLFIDHGENASMR